MSRLLATMKLDVMLQWRYGFYGAGAFVAVISILIMWQVNPNAYEAVLPGMLFVSLLVTTFYFIAGLVLFEKGEGVLQGLITTPLRINEYLISKLVTLTVLAAAEQVLIVSLTYGITFGIFSLNIPAFIISIVLWCVLGVLVGFAFVARFDSITEFLLPSSLIGIIAVAPWFDIAGVIDFPPLVVIPTYGAMLLFGAAFDPLSGVEGLTQAEIVISITITVLAIVAGFIYARQTFRKFIIRSEGVRS